MGSLGPRLRPCSSSQQATEGGSQSGAVLTEAALALPLFLVIVFAGIECTRMAVLALSLQFVADEGARWISLGCSAPAACTDTDRMNTITNQLALYSSGYGIPIQSARLCVTAQGQSGCTAFGKPRDLVRLGVEYDVHVFGMKLLSYTLKSESIFRNETF